VVNRTELLVCVQCMLGCWQCQQLQHLLALVCWLICLPVQNNRCPLSVTLQPHTFNTAPRHRCTSAANTCITYIRVCWYMYVWFGRFWVLARDFFKNEILTFWLKYHINNVTQVSLALQQLFAVVCVLTYVIVSYLFRFSDVHSSKHVYNNFD